MRLQVLAWLLAAGLFEVSYVAGGCAQKCSGVQSKFKYVKGSSYSYKYESQTKVQLVGNSKSSPSVNLEATVTISVLDACDFVLQLSNVKLVGPQVALVGFDLAKDLEKSPLAFSFDDGSIQGICPEGAETADVLNVKRGVLSTFQIANDFDSEETYENDISGNCPTKHTKQESGDTVQVTKVKKLQGCRNHLSLYTSIRFVPYSAVSKVQNSPYFKAKQECKYKIKQNLLNEALCEEKHRMIYYGDYKKTGAGIVATVTSKLTLGPQGKASVVAKGGPVKPLTFDDNRIIWREAKEATAKAKNTLKILCDTASQEVRPESPGHFVELVHHLKSVPLEDLRTLGKEAKSSTPCPKASNFFVDAVAQCGSQACVIVLTQLLTPKANPDLPVLGPLQQKLVLVNLALTAHPTKGGVAAVTKVLTDLPAGGLYASTAFVNGYCRLHDKCQEQDEPKAFIQKYVGLMDKVKPSKKPRENLQHIETLRAFGNLGYFTDGIAERLKHVTADAHNDVRLAAIQSLRRVPCTPQIENGLFGVFVDEKQNIEIRLNAFSVLVRQCASSELIKRVANATEEIKLNQIGSYVQSYFMAMRNSKNPTKDKDIFARAHLKRKFRSDSFRHSKFCENSNFNHKANLGYHSDSSLIFTPDGLFPKQASFNLSLDLFGREVNLFEFGIRTDFLDEAADLIFGPEGYLTSAAGFSNREDRKISIKEPKISEFQNEYNKRRPVSAGLDLFAYLRIYGEEVGYLSDYGIPIIDRLQRIVKPEAIVNFLAEPQTSSFNIHRLPYDHHANFPSMSGFPLRLSANGTLAINLEVGGKADLKDAPNGNFDVILSLKPSAALQFAFQMAVYVGTVKNGVRYQRNSHTSTALAFNFKYSGHDTVGAKLELPKNRQELASIESHVYSIVNDVPIEEKGVEANKGEGSACTPKKWSDCTGLKLCTRYGYSNSSNVPNAPGFPLSGPFNAEVYLEKTDPKLNSFDLTASWKASKVGRDILFLFDTPNSQVNRQTKLTLKYERQKALDLEYKTPSNHITAKGTLTGAGPDQTSAVVSIGANGKTYEVIGKVQRTALPLEGRKYVFDGDVKESGKSTTGKVKGNMEIQPGNKARVEGDVTGLFDKPLTYKGGYEKNKATGKYDVEHDLRGPWGYNRLKGDVSFKHMGNLGYSFDVESQKLPAEPTPHKLGYAHTHSVDFHEFPRMLKATANSKLTSSKFPAANIGYDVLCNVSPGKVLIKASTIESGKPGLSYEQVTNKKLDEYVTNAVLKHPLAKVDEKFTVVYRNKFPKDFETSVKWNSLSSKKDYEASAIVKRPKAEGYEGDYNAVVRFPGTEYKIVKNIKQGDQPGQLICDTLIQYAPDKQIKLKSTYKGTFRQDFEIQSNVQFPGAAPFDFSESHKLTADGGKFLSNVKKAGKVLYDADFDWKTVSPIKKTIKGSLKSPDQAVDVGFDGLYEIVAPNRRVIGTFTSNKKDHSKVDILVPNSFKYNDEKQGRMGVVWALGDPSSKELNFDFKTSKAGPSAMDHEGSLKIKFPNADYKFELKRRHGDTAATNFTVLKTNKPLIEVSVVRSHKSPDPKSTRGIVDLAVRTHPPMTPRDLSGSATYDFAEKRCKAALSLADKTNKQKAAADFDASQVQGGYDQSLSLSANDYEAKLKNLYVRKSDGREVKGEAIIKDQSKKEQQKFNWSLIGNLMKFQGYLETPFPTMPKIAVSGDSTFEQNKRRGKYSLLCGKNKINADYNVDFADKYSLVNVSVDTTYDAFKKARYTVKQDSRKGLDLDFKLDLNDIHKVGALYQRTTQPNGDEKWVTNLQTKLGSKVDWESNLDALWNNPQGKYVTKNSVRTSATQRYRTDLDFNSKTMQVKVDMENVPGIKAPVTGQAKKIGENEYEIKLQDATGPNKGLIAFKFTNPQQNFRVETGAFKSSYEAENTDKKWSVGGELVPDVKANKPYGLKLGMETPDQDTRGVDLQLGYPERKISWGSKLTHKLGSKFEHITSLNYNVGKREPTVLRSLVTRGQNAPTVAELHLADPKLPQGLHVESKFTRQGNYEDENADYSSQSEISLKYSADPKKHFLVKTNKKRQAANLGSKNSHVLEISHPATNLNNKIWSNYDLGPLIAGGNMAYSSGISFTDQKKAPHEYSVDFKRTFNTYDVAANVDNAKYAIARKGGKGQAGYTISRDGKEIYEIVGEATKGKDGQFPAASFSFINKLANAVVLKGSAALDSNDLASVKFYHGDDKGKLIKDIDGVVKLEKSNLLRVKYTKRPGLTEAIQRALELYSPKALVDTVKKQGLPADFAGRESIGKDVLKEIQPMLDSWDKEEDDVAKELQIASGKFGSALKDQITAISSAFSAAIQQSREICLNIGKVFQDIFGGYAQTVRETASKIPELTSKVLPALKESYDSGAKRFKEIYIKFMDVLAQSYEGSNVKTAVEPLIKAIKGASDGPMYKRLLEILKSLRQTAADPKAAKGPVADFMGKIEAIRQQGYKQILDYVDNLRKEAAKNPDYKDSVKFLDDVYGKLDGALNFAESKKQAIGAANDLYESYTKGGKIFPNFNRSADGNTVTINVPLYYDYTSLPDLLSALCPVRVGSSIREFGEKVSNKFGGPDSRGLFESTKGLLVGEQHYVTFDGEIKPIGADCTFLLARDFFNQRFSVLVKIEKSVRKSIIVQYDGDSFEIDYENAVSINGRSAELPYNRDDRGLRSKVNIIQEDDFIVTLKTFDGLKVVCNSFNHICSVILSPRFRGKTNGLLGPNDGESFTDLSLPNGQVAANLADHVRSWAIQPACAASQNKARIEKLLADHTSSTHCDGLFGKTYRRSAFSRCSGLNLDHFKDLCLRDTLDFTKKIANVSGHDQGACQAAAAFLTACEHSADLPDQCLKCDIGGKKLDLHKSETVASKAQLKQIDALFIVENNHCLSDFQRQIGLIGQKVEGNLKQAGYDVKFGLVGFNGMGVHETPTFHSVKNSVKFGAADLQGAVTKLTFGGESLSLTNPLDVLDEIIEHFPFRPASRKLLVLFTCSSCATPLELDYFDLHSKLLGQSFSLHVVTKETIQLSGASPAHYIGFDASSFIKLDLKEDMQARPNLVEPHDSCTVLAQETNGTIFSISDKLNFNPVTAALASALTQNAAGNDCVACECTSHDFFPKVVCLRCEVPKPVALTGDRSGFFNNPFQKLAKLNKQP